MSHRPPNDPPYVLALETSCDETAAAVTAGWLRTLASVISSQIPLHRPYGGVVPEVASRNHLTIIRPVVEDVMDRAVLNLDEMSAFAATVGPGLASSLMIGATFAKSLAWSLGKPFYGINHLEGHLLSPFEGRSGIEPAVGLVVSGGHTLLVDVRAFGDYTVLGTTRDDAAGEAFDKVAKLLGLPYPGGPQIEEIARERGGNAHHFGFPRSMIRSGDFNFSFSGMKTAVRYQLPDPDQEAIRDGEHLGHVLDNRTIADVCASFQEAVVDVLVEKSRAALRYTGRQKLAVSGGVSRNARLRERLETMCNEEGVQLLLARPVLCTDNAAMIAYAASHYLAAGADPTPLDADIDPNLALLSR